MIECNCVKDHEQALKKEFGPETEIINAVFMFDAKARRHWRSPPQLRFRYHDKKADGTYSKKWKTSFVINNFCPLCGKKRSK